MNSTPKQEINSEVQQNRDAALFEKDKWMCSFDIDIVMSQLPRSLLIVPGTPFIL
jgi:hypothetical protein